MNKVYNKYISNVKALFPVKGKAEKKYINNFKINVLDYVEENDVTSEEVLHAEFGTPSEVVNTYFSSVDSEYVVKRVKHSRWLKVSAVTVFFAAIIGVSIYGGVKAKEYIAFMEEKVAMKELAKGDVDAPEYTESEWKKYSTFTKYAVIPLYAVVGEYTGFNNKIKFIVLDDCRIVALDTSNERLFICGADNSVRKVDIGRDIDKVWSDKGRLYIGDSSDNVYEVVENKLEVIHDVTYVEKDFSSEEALVWKDKENTTVKVVGTTANGDIYTHEVWDIPTDSTPVSEDVIRRYDSKGNVIEYAYFDTFDCEYMENVLHLDNNGNVWLMLCKDETLEFYLVTLGNADESIAKVREEMWEAYDELTDSIAIDCVEAGVSLNEIKGRYKALYPNDKTQINLGLDAKFVTTSKTLSLKNDKQEVVGELMITATFAYDGVIARCISIAPDAKTYSEGWTIEKYSTTDDVGKAVVSAVFVHEAQDGEKERYTSEVTIVCGPNGKIH